MLLHLHQRHQRGCAHERRNDHHQHAHTAKAAPNAKPQEQQDRQPCALLFLVPEPEHEPQNQEGQHQMHGIMQAVDDDVIVYVVKRQHQHRRQIRRSFLHAQLIRHIQETHEHQRKAHRLRKDARRMPCRHELQANLIKRRRADDAQLGRIHPVFRVYPAAVTVDQRSMKNLAAVISAHIMRTAICEKSDRQYIGRRHHEPRQRTDYFLFHPSFLRMVSFVVLYHCFPALGKAVYSTVTLLARLRGLSTSSPRSQAM